jgi:hypothetical protein
MEEPEFGQEERGAGATSAANAANGNESDSDDDLDAFMAELNDDPLISAIESENRARMVQAAQRQEMAMLLGYGVHIEDSAEHIKTYVDSYQYVVLHMYDPDSEDSALLDLLLEQLATTYQCTLFRRIPLTAVTDTALEPLVDGNAERGRAALGCFKGGSSVAWTCDLAPFVSSGGSNSDAVASLHNFLDHAHCLSNDVDEAILRAGAERQAAMDDVREEELFCDMPGCTKRFAHQHVGSGRPGQKSLLFSPNEEGAEAFGGRTI